MKFLIDEIEFKKSEGDIRIKELEDSLKQSESKKSEIEFLFDELSVKVDEQRKSIEDALAKKYTEQIESLEFALEENKIDKQDLESATASLKELKQKLKTVEETNTLLDKQLEELKNENSIMVSLNTR